jgi:hypothetical protein
MPLSKISLTFIWLNLLFVFKKMVTHHHTLVGFQGLQDFKPLSLGFAVWGGRIN